MKYTLSLVLLLSIFSQTVHAAELGGNIDNNLKQCKNKSVSTIDSQKCLNVALKEWDAELGKQYKLLMNKQPDNVRIAIRDSQRSWIKYKDQYIAAMDMYYKQQEGSIWSLISAESKLNITRDKAIDLYRLRNSTDLSSLSNDDTSNQQENKVSINNSRNENRDVLSEPAKEEEIILNPDFKSVVDDFFTQYLSFNEKDMDINFDDFNNKVKYLYNVSGQKVNYTNNKEVYTYELSYGIRMIAFITKKNNRVNYVGMIYNSHEGGTLKDFVLSNIKISMILQNITDPTKITAFISQFAKNGDGEGVFYGNKYRTYNKNGGYVFIVRKQ